MTRLYTKYADLYHKMYQSLIDYDEEYQFYKKLLDKHLSATIWKSDVAQVSLRNDS